MEPATQHFRSRTGPVIEALKANAEKWNETHNGASQTAVFRDVMPTAVGGGVKGDFTSTFNSLGFDAIFTSDKLALKMMGPVYNSNFLYRDTRGAVKIPVFGNDKYIVQHPLGDPGVDLGSGTKSKVSHLMVVSCADTGPVTFNEMLPSDKAEVDDLESRLNFLNSAFDGLKENIPISGCGKAVTDRATEMDVPLTTGMREFLALQISSLGDDIRTGRPGYRLLNAEDEDIADAGCATILAAINELFDDDSLDLVPCIQDNTNCSQLITHIHGFRIGKDVPQGLKDTYTDCRTILRVKKHWSSALDVSLYGEGLARRERQFAAEALSRTASVAGGALGRTASVAGSALGRTASVAGDALSRTKSAVSKPPLGALPDPVREMIGRMAEAMEAMRAEIAELKADRGRSQERAAALETRVGHFVSAHEVCVSKPPLARQETYAVSIPNVSEEEYVGGEAAPHAERDRVEPVNDATPVADSRGSV